MAPPCSAQLFEALPNLSQENQKNKQPENCFTKYSVIGLSFFYLVWFWSVLICVLFNYVLDVSVDSKLKQLV